MVRMVSTDISCLLHSLSILSLPLLSHAAFFEPAPSPELDLEPLGRIALTGNFDAVSLYSYIQESNGGPAGFNGSQSQSLIASLPNGALAPISSADADIVTMCPLYSEDGDEISEIIIGGNFTSLGGIESPGIARFNPKSSRISAISGLSGQVLALLCDKESSTVYLGGEFRDSKSSNAMSWSSESGLSGLPFGGFNGPVTSIVRSQDDRIVFGGSFDGLGNATAPSMKDQQIINLETAQISAQTSSTTMPGSDDPRSVICPGDKSSPWLLTDESPGHWQADMHFGFEPTKLRIRNTHMDGRGTKTFRFTALPDGGILNMTYTDPDSGDKVACDARCPLSDDPSEKFRDFKFVNIVGMNGFRLDISDWYGKGAGLDGVELFQDDIFSYAVKDFNEPSCAGLPFGSSVSKNGDWTVTPSQQSAADYLSAKVNPSEGSSTSVTFKPDIRQSGNYSVIIYTPGCIQDGTCATRGVVNVTGEFESSGGKPAQALISQRNNYDKYDEIYSGQVDASSGKFSPFIKVTPERGQSEVDIVASRVQFQLKSSNGGLNGLYEYDPAEKEARTANLTKSAVAMAGATLDSDAKIESLVWEDGTLFVGGNFSNSSTQNLFSLTDGEPSSLPDDGLDSVVNSMLVLDGLLYVGGNFSNTIKGNNDDLKGVAIYDISEKSWRPMGSGVNGPVTSVVRFPLKISSDKTETTVAVSGDFTEIKEAKGRDSISARGFAVWVPSEKKWLQQLKVEQMAYVGQISASVKLGKDDETLLAGNLATGGIASHGAVSLNEDNDKLDLKSLPINIKLDDATKSSKRKRSFEKEDAQGVLTGLFDKSSGRNMTILAGHFTATNGGDSTINNLLFLNGAKDDAVTGAGSGVEDKSTFLALGIQGDLLFAGGLVQGRVADSDVNGLVVYDLAESKYISGQPGILDGGEVIVRSIAPRPDSSDVYIGGHFQSAGSLPCPSVCNFAIESEQWKRPGAGMQGNVSTLLWATGTKLIAAGNLTVDGNHTMLATYDTEEEQWSVLSGAGSDRIEGEITAVSSARDDGSELWIAGKSTSGSSFLVLYDGEEFRSVGSLFGDSTTIQGLQVLTVKKDHDSNKFLDKNRVLLVTGQLQLPDFGIVSGGLYNGTAIEPFILSSMFDGKPGSITGLFSENKIDLPGSAKPRPRGIVVLISFCIALGWIFLLVLVGMLVNKIRRRNQGYVTAPQGTDRKPDLKRVPPEYLLDSLRHRAPGVPTV